MLGRDDTLDISAFPAVPALAVFPLTALTTSIGSRRWTKHRYAVADHGGGARDWRVPPITREPIDFGFGDEQEPMTDETITLEFLAGRIERVLEEIAQMRGDLFVMTGMIHRLDGTVKVLANEVIEHACLEPQMRKLGDE